MPPRRSLPQNPKAYKAMELLVRGKTQNQVANRLDVAPSTVSSWRRKIEGTAPRPKAVQASPRAVVPQKRQHTTTAVKQAVAKKSRTTILEPGRVIVHEQVYQQKASTSVTNNQPGPSKKTNRPKTSNKPRKNPPSKPVAINIFNISS